MLSYDFFKEFFENSAVLDNKYNILQTIGEGRYAKVKLAVSIEDRKKYAIKIMREDQVNSVAKLEGFLNEVQILSSIHNKNIVQIVHVNLNGECKKPNGKIVKVVYYVMKFAEYGELFEILQKTTNFSEKMARYYFRQLIQSIEYLHNNCVGHRDIKTENILIDHKFNLKLADFGSACRSRDHNLQRVGFSNQNPVGSPEYNAPEITNNFTPGEYYAEDADVFASASALFVMVLQSIPFNSSMFNDPYYSRLCKKDNTVKFWKIFDPENTLTVEFKDLIERMMEPNPQKRITIDGIKQHPWYLDATPSYEEVAAEMKKRGEIILIQNEEKFRNYRAEKLQKTKGDAPKDRVSSKRKGLESEVENLIQMMQVEISDINLKLIRESKQRTLRRMNKEDRIRSSPEICKPKCRRRSSEENMQKEKQEPSGFQGDSQERNICEGSENRQFGGMRKNSGKEDRIKMRRSGSDD